MGSGGNPGPPVGSGGSPDIFGSSFFNQSNIYTYLEFDLNMFIFTFWGRQVLSTAPILLPERLKHREFGNSQALNVRARPQPLKPTFSTE